MKVASVAFSKKKTKQEVSQEFCMTKQKIYNLPNVVQENKQPMGSGSADQTPLDTVLICLKTLTSESFYDCSKDCMTDLKTTSLEAVLGDSGYPLKKWLITPSKNSATVEKRRKPKCVYLSVAVAS